MLPSPASLKVNRYPGTDDARHITASEDGLHLTCLSVPSTRHSAWPMVTELSWYRDEDESKSQSWTLGPDRWPSSPTQSPRTGRWGWGATCGEPRSQQDRSCQESRENCLRRGGEASECPAGRSRAGVEVGGAHSETSY